MAHRCDGESQWSTYQVPRDLGEIMHLRHIHRTLHTLYLELELLPHPWFARPSRNLYIHHFLSFSRGYLTGWWDCDKDELAACERVSVRNETVGTHVCILHKFPTSCFTLYFVFTRHFLHTQHTAQLTLGGRFTMILLQRDQRWKVELLQKSLGEKQFIHYIIIPTLRWRQHKAVLLS